MKKIIGAVLLLLLVAGTTQAQIRTLPSEVTNAFQERYPNAKDVSWKDNLTNFHVSFKNAGLPSEAKFNADGTWLETDTKLKRDELTAPVKDGFTKSKYVDWEFRGATEIHEKDKEIVYRILVQKGAVQKKYLFFNEQGQLKREALAL